MGVRAEEDQPQGPALQATGELALFDSSGQFQHRLDVGGGPVFEGQKITLGHGTFGELRPDWRHQGEPPPEE